mgnify:CR=1 FL=1
MTKSDLQEAVEAEKDKAEAQRQAMALRLQLQEQKDGSYLFDRVEIKPGKTQKGMTEILNAAELTKDAQYLSKGAFELIQE